MTLQSTPPSLKRQQTAAGASARAGVADERHRAKALLEELSWSQTKLASKLGVAPNTVSRWFTGALPVPPWVCEYLQTLLALRQLAARFDVL